MPRFWESSSKAAAGSSSLLPVEDTIASSSSTPPRTLIESTNDSNLNIPMTTRWYIFFDGGVPNFLVPMCEALNLSWSIVKNSTEGSSGPVDTMKNKFRERFMILFPEDLDGLPDLTEDKPPPMYTGEKAENARKATTKRNIFDTLSGDLEYLHTRNGLGELFNSLFMTRTLRSIVQVRAARQDKSIEDYTKIRGVEIDLRTLEFKDLQDIEGKLDELTRQGVIWAKYGLWCSKSLNPEENLQKGDWIIFGTWPNTIKRVSITYATNVSYNEKR